MEKGRKKGFSLHLFKMMCNYNYMNFINIMIMCEYSYEIA